MNFKYGLLGICLVMSAVSCGDNPCEVEDCDLNYEVLSTNKVFYSKDSSKISVDVKVGLLEKDSISYFRSTVPSYKNDKLLDFIEAYNICSCAKIKIFCSLIDHSAINSAKIANRDYLRATENCATLNSNFNLGSNFKEDPVEDFDNDYGVEEDDKKVKPVCQNTLVDNNRIKFCFRKEYVEIIPEKNNFSRLTCFVNSQNPKVDYKYIRRDFKGGDSSFLINRSMLPREYRNNILLNVTLSNDKGVSSIYKVFE
jgi:hypothetical protein